MNNGQGGQNPTSMELQLLPPNGIVSLEQFNRNLEQIARARETLATLEAQNAEGYRRYVEQELWNRVQAGREAE